MIKFQRTGSQTGESESQSLFESVRLTRAKSTKRDQFANSATAFGLARGDGIDLDSLQDHDEVSRRYPRVDVHEVERAAEELQKIVEGELHYIPDCKEEFRGAFMFKGRPMLTSSLLHFAIWYVVEAAADPQLVREVLNTMKDPDDIFIPGRYQAGSGKVCFVDCVHLASGSGRVQILDILLDHVTRKTSPSKRVKTREYVTQWTRIYSTSATVDDYLDVNSTEEYTKFYQPIHESTFAGSGDITLWLLQQQADPDTPNLHSITPLHFVAFRGLTLTLEAQVTEELNKVVAGLLSKGQSSTAVADMSKFIPGLKSATPLEVAIQDASRFPVDNVGLLAPCLVDSSKLTYFEDVRQIADVSADAAMKLVLAITEKAKEDMTVLHRFQMNAQLDGSSDILANIFYMAPLAAADMLDLLEVFPEVEDAAKYAIPTKASFWGLFHNQPMRCTYQSDAVVKDTISVPVWSSPVKFTIHGAAKEEYEWQDKFIPKAPRSVRSSHVANASVIASLLPNILDIDIFMSIARCQQDTLDVMNQKTVQGLIYCLWQNLLETLWFLEVLARFIDMCAYINFSFLAGSNDHLGLGTLCVPLIIGSILSGLLTTIFHNIAVFRKWAHHKEPTMREMWSPFSIWNFRYWFPLFVKETLSAVLLLRFTLMQPADGHRHILDSILLALCILMACFRFLWMFRLSTIGSSFFTIYNTFFAAAVNQMLLILILMLAAFVACLMTLSGFHDTKMATDAYRGFLFGDGDGLNGVGFDIDRGGLYDHNNAFLGFSVFGSFFFNVIVLNMVIAVYGHEYEKSEKEKPQLFMMGRADYCAKTILSAYIIPWGGKFLKNCLIASSLLAIAAGIVLCKLFGFILIPGELFTFAQLVLPMACIQCEWFSPEGEDAENKQRYLWLCQPHERKGMFEEGNLNGLGDEMMIRQEEMEHKLITVDEKLANMDQKVDRQLAALDDRLAQMTNLIQQLANANRPMTPPRDAA